MPVTTSQLTTEQKVLASIDLVSQTASQIASAFGHTSVGSAIGEYSSLAPVFAGLFDTVRGLFAHKIAQTAPVQIAGSGQSPA